MKTPIEQLREVTAIQRQPGNSDYSEYMRGMANGLILALAIMEEKEPEFIEAPAESEVNPARA